MLTGGLDRRVSAFLRVELTHAPRGLQPVQKDTARPTLPTQGGLGVRWLGSIRHRSPGAELCKGGEERGAVAAGVIAKDLDVFYLDRVLQRLVEQIIEAHMVGKAGFNSASWSRTSERGSGGEVLRRDRALGLARAVLNWKLGHYFFVSLFWQTLFLVFMRQSTQAFENFIRFLREDEVGS